MKKKLGQNKVQQNTVEYIIKLILLFKLCELKSLRIMLFKFDLNVVLFFKTK